jgi:hypothetical protein
MMANVSNFRLSTEIIKLKTESIPKGSDDGIITLRTNCLLDFVHHPDKI